MSQAEPTDEDVTRLAEAWEPYATLVEKEITAGWESSEPTRLMWRIKAYLFQHSPSKATKFEDRFFKHLD